MIDYLILNIEHSKKFLKGALFFLLIAAVCLSCAAAKDANDANTPKQSDAKTINNAGADKIDTILGRLDNKSREIKTYEAKIIHLFKQPVLESETLENGTLYYLNDANSSKLRINFINQRQDGDPVPNYREEYFFDGINLTRVMYKSKTVEYRQLTDVNKPLNVFDLASQYLPIVGFTKADKLKEEFEISLISQPDRASGSDLLLLKTKPQSQYKKDYTQIKFWVDKKTSMPLRMEAVSPLDDIHDIRLEDAKVNKSLPKGIFDIEVPSNFDKNIVPLKN